MRHLIRYTFKAKIRNFNILFWSFLFPLILATFMYFSIGNIEEADFEVIPVAVVKGQQDTGKTAEGQLTGQQENQTEGEGQDVFAAFLEQVSDKTDEEDGLISIRQMTEDEALHALEEKEIDGIFYTGEEPSLTVGAGGMAQTVLQALLNSYENGKQVLLNVAEDHPEGMEAAIESLSGFDNLVSEVSLGGKTTNGNSQFFYALVGMACLYGCFIGFGSAMDLQANLTALAARKCVSPAHKLKLVLTEMLVSFGIHFFNILVLLVYLRFVLRVEFNGNFLSMLPVCLLGSMIGVAMGQFISSIGKMGEGIKIGILLGISMGLSFFAGLFNAEMKDYVDRTIPLLNRVNPAALISDALYCIHVYDAPERYVRDLGILAVFCVLLVLGAFLIVRRERYDSI